MKEDTEKAIIGKMKEAAAGMVKTYAEGTEIGEQLALDIKESGVSKDTPNLLSDLEAVQAKFENGEILAPPEDFTEAVKLLFTSSNGGQAEEKDIGRIVEAALRKALSEMDGISEDARKVATIAISTVSAFLGKSSAEIKGLLTEAIAVDTLEPFIEAELQEAAAKDEALKQYSAADVFGLLTQPTGEASPGTPEILRPVIERAVIKWREQTAAQEQAEKKKPKGAKKRAEQIGALTTIGNRAAYLAPQKGVPELALQALSRTCLFYLPTDADISQTIDPKTGKMNPLFLTERRPQENIEEAHTGLFGSLMNAAIQSYTPEEQDKNSFIIYLPDILKELGIEPRTYSTERAEQLQFTDDHGEVKIRTLAELRYNKMLELLVPYDRVVGMMPDGSFYRFLTFGAYKKDTETMEIITPFLFEMCRQYDETRYTFLMHSDIANERNQAAVEVVLAILRGLAKRGTTHPDARGLPGAAPAKKKRTTKKKNGDVVTEEITFTTPEPATEQKKEKRAEPIFSYEVSYKTIIEDCPQLQKAIEDIIKGKKTKEKKQEKGTNKADGEKKEEGAAKDKWKLQAVNSKLKQVFTAAFRILFEKTDAPLYYKNLHFTTNVVTDPEGRPIKDKAGNISYFLPTNTTLHRKIGLAHNGRNREYKRK